MEKKKDLSIVYREKYGYVPGYLSSDFWKMFEFDYSITDTKGLLSVLDLARNHDHRYSEYRVTPETPSERKMRKIIGALKKELSTREHIPNKKERKELRKEIFLKKKNK